jgi:hypothetical protein
MSTTAIPSRRTAALYRAVLIVDVALLTLPLIYLTLADGHMAVALGYVIGAPLIVVITMFILGWIDGTKEAEDF